MRVVYFTHSLISCWNNGNAHFLRGILNELLHRGHEVVSFEPEDSWSRTNLLKDMGVSATAEVARTYPDLSLRSGFLKPDVDAMLDGADVVLVHEWNDPDLVAAIGRRRARGGQFILLFHDTHHRAVSDPNGIHAIDLSAYDGVLAFGNSLSDIYRGAGWGDRCFVWHEAADIRVFRTPAMEAVERQGVVWIGNWGDEERSQELHDFLLRPVFELSLKLDMYGVRYPQHARLILAEMGANYLGYLPNPQVPATFSRYLLTVHIPRRIYVDRLVGIPTIRMFEALACGIPLICAPWTDSEHIFRKDIDYLTAETSDQMRQHMAAVAADRDLRRSMVAHGLETITTRHTCAHRVDELLAIVASLKTASAI